MIPDSAYTRAGDRVTSLEPHKGLIRGIVVIGERQDGEPVITSPTIIRPAEGSGRPL